MEKEINDQGQSALYSLNDRVDFENHSIEFKELIKSLKTLNKIKRVILIGMGSSFNACMLGAKYFESLTKIPAIAENSSEFLYSEKIIATNLHWISNLKLDTTKELTAKIRYRQKDQFCNIEVLNNNSAIVTFQKPVFAAAPGQSIVFYNVDECLGGGIIEPYVN